MLIPSWLSTDKLLPGSFGELKSLVRLDCRLQSLTKVASTNGSAGLFAGFVEKVGPPISLSYESIDPTP